MKGEAAAADLQGLRAALAAHGIAFIGPLGFENRYALAMRADQAAHLRVHAISDLLGHPTLSIGVSNEFLRRRDGWPGLAAHYGLPASQARGLDHELAIRGLDAGALDVIDVYRPTPRLRATNCRFWPTTAAISPTTRRSCCTAATPKPAGPPPSRPWGGWRGRLTRRQ